MCVNPRWHPNGLRTPCHQCWQCKENRISDWVGRCIAEAETSLGASVVTLTYGGGDVPEARFLRKSDITTYIKALRNAGHKVRYFAVGEYGTKKGRAHFHVVLFWQSPAPHREMRKNIQCEFWPHGYSFWDDATPQSMRYCMKYIQKDDHDDRSLNCYAMSRKPMLGWQFLYGLAGRYCDAGLSPQRPFYKFRDVVDQHGNDIQFYMPPLVASHFCSAFIFQWQARYPGRHWPHSDLVDKYHDKLVQYVPPIALKPFKRGESPWMLPPPGYVQRFDEKLNSFYADKAGDRLFWSYDDEGNRAWAKKIVTAEQADAIQSRKAVSAMRA